MNSRSSVNESNLVNFSADLTTLNQLDTKDSLLSFPFDHLYACHSESTDRRQALQLDKEVEISTHCVVGEEKDLVVSNSSEITRLNDRISVTENQNKKLKDLLVYHLDLIQQQNDLITKREKLYIALKQENDTLKSKLTRMDKKATVNQRHNLNPPPLVNVAHPPVTSTVVKNENTSCTSTQIMFNSYTELLLPDNRTNSYLFNSDLSKPKPFGHDPFDLARSTEADVSSYLSTDLGVTSMSILGGNINCESLTMIESKTSFIKKEIKMETRSEPLYTVTSNSGTPIIQRNRSRRTTAGVGSLSRMPRSTAPKVERPQASKMYGDDKSFSVNKKSKMINTYGKSKNTNPKKLTQFTGSLSDRLKLIDTTPTGEDPYQLGEADMREQSPIPKLMLQKTNHGRLRVSSDTMETATRSRRIYDSPVTARNTKATNKLKLNRYDAPSTYVPASKTKKEADKTLMVEEPDLDIIKTEPEIDWRMYTTNPPSTATSLCDFSYGENSNNLASHLLPDLDTMEFQKMFSSDASLNLESLTTVDYNLSTDKTLVDKSKRRTVRTTSLIGGNLAGGGSIEVKRGVESKRGRKRALSATSHAKTVKQDSLLKPPAPKPRLIKGKGLQFIKTEFHFSPPCRGKKPLVPGLMTRKPYHTLMGDPDVSWYLGLDPNLKSEDIDPPTESTISTVEVPRWREKPYTSCYTLEGTENLDNRVFERRHLKLEAEERRQLRWHMRRIREQRHMERLRLRQRDPWCSPSAATVFQPSVFTIWPQPQRDVQQIQITDTLPVMAFGDVMPSLPHKDFMLPWIRKSKALKRSDRAKTLL